MWEDQRWSAQARRQSAASLVNLHPNKIPATLCPARLWGLLLERFRYYSTFLAAPPDGLRLNGFIVP